jgi:hypothetical protein
MAGAAHAGLAEGDSVSLRFLVKFEGSFLLSG